MALFGRFLYIVQAELASLWTFLFVFSVKLVGLDLGLFVILRFDLLNEFTLFFTLKKKKKKRKEREKLH